MLLTLPAGAVCCFVLTTSNGVVTAAASDAAAPAVTTGRRDRHRQGLLPCTIPHRVGGQPEIKRSLSGIHQFLPLP